MKRFLTLTLALAMVLSLFAGCQPKNQESSVSTSSTLESRETESSSSEEVQESSSEVEVSETSEELSSMPLEETVVPTRGVWEGEVWHSDFAQLSFTLPEGWEKATDEMIAQAMNIGADLLSEQGLDFSAEMLEEATIYDLLVFDVTGTNVIIGMENLTANSAFGGLISEKSYLEIVKRQLDEMDMYTISEVGTEEIGGNTYATMLATDDSDDISISQKYCVRKINNYIFLIIISSLEEDGFTEIMQSFS